MRYLAVLAALACAGASVEARAYCIHNELKETTVTLLQDHHPDKIREERRMRATLKPGDKVCCEVKQLDCNPEGKPGSPVSLMVTIDSDPPRACGVASGQDKERFVKVAGNGVLRIQDNKRSAANPYIIRITGADGRDVTGPSGLACQ